MKRNFRLNTFVGFLAAVLALFAFTCQHAEAQVKPFKVKGEGNAPEGLSLIPFDAGPYTASGTATHLGVPGFGIAYLTTDNPGPIPPGAAFNFSFSGGFVFVAANGDRLVCEHPGTVAVYPDGAGRFYAVFDAIFTPASLTIGETTYTSTGKFKNVGGSFRMIATTESFDIDFGELRHIRVRFQLGWRRQAQLPQEIIVREDVGPNKFPVPRGFRCVCLRPGTRCEKESGDESAALHNRRPSTKWLTAFCLKRRVAALITRFVVAILPRNVPIGHAPRRGHALPSRLLVCNRSPRKLLGRFSGHVRLPRK